MTQVARVVRGQVNQPKPRTKINSMNDAAALVTSRYVTGPDATAGAAQFAYGFPVFPTYYGGSDAGGAVLRNYQEYTMKHQTLTYTPAVGTTTAGTIWLGYYDNPELIYKIQTSVYTIPQLLALAKQSPVSVSGPIWMPLTMAVPMAKRRAKYSCNSTFPGSRADTDLEVHGMVIMATEGVPFSTTFGSLSWEYSAAGYHLVNNSIAGI